MFTVALVAEAVVATIVCLATCWAGFALEWRKPSPPIPAVRPHHDSEATWILQVHPHHDTIRPAPNHSAPGR
jgi:hypothetical protein